MYEGTSSTTGQRCVVPVVAEVEVRDHTERL